MSAGRKDHVAEIQWAITMLESALKQKWDADAMVEDKRRRLARALDEAFTPAPEREKEGR